MRFYKALQEKGQYFIKRNLKVDNLSNLLALIEEFSGNGKESILFRGQPEAKYMLYSSLQRYWVERKLEKHYGSYRELIDNLIENSRKWNSGLIKRYLKNSGWNETKMSILSIMQHYGVPTPLLDFTYDINKSLYFAVNKIDISPPVSDIEKYFSIYYIYKDNPVLGLNDEKSDKQKNNDLDLAMESGISLIDNTNEAYRIQNNLNILNQEGAFIFNSSPKDPLEKHYFKHVSQLKRVSGKELPQEIGGCININKKIADDLRDFLQEKGIDRYSMFPDLNELSRDCLNMEWQKIKSGDQE